MFTSYLRSGVLAAALIAVFPALGNATIILADDDLSGSMLNIFEFNYPSNLIDLTVQGTVTTADPDASLLGSTLSFSSNLLSGSGTLTLNGSSISVTDGAFMGVYGGYDFDPATASGRQMVFKVVNAPGPVQSVSGSFPNEMFTYEDPWSAFGAFPGPPDLELILTIFFDGEFPVRFFDESTLGLPASMIPFTEGPLNVTRLTLGTEVGAPPPTAVVPLPLTSLLLVSGLGALGALHRKRRSA